LENSDGKVVELSDPVSDLCSSFLDYLEKQPFIESVDRNDPGAVAIRLRSLGRDDVEMMYGQPRMRVIVNDLRLTQDFPGRVTAARKNNYYDDWPDDEAVWDLLASQLRESLIGPAAWKTQVVYDQGDFVRRPRRPQAPGLAHWTVTHFVPRQREGCTDNLSQWTLHSVGMSSWSSD
jgi:hypothetical protein